MLGIIYSEINTLRTGISDAPTNYVFVKPSVVRQLKNKHFSWLGKENGGTEAGEESWAEASLIMTRFKATGCSLKKNVN